MRAFIVATAAVSLTSAVLAMTDATVVTNAEALRNSTAISLTWKSTGPVNVLMSLKPDATPDQMTLISENDTDGKHTVTDVDTKTRPYFYIKPQSGDGTRVAVRLLPLEGGRNFRDMGGYPTEDGRHVKWGHVFRSGMMADLTDADYDYLSGLGIQTVCDFRANEERADEPTEWAAGDIDYVTWDYAMVTGSEDLRTMFQDPELTPAKVKAGMAKTYFGIIEDHKHQYKEMFHRLAEGEIPLAFNCSAGKDRAGTGAALILSALGVPRDLVVEDYALSEKMVDYEAAFGAGGMSEEEIENSPYGFLAKLPAEMRAPLLRSDPDYIRGTFAYLDETYGGVDAFIRDELDIDDIELAKIRSSLLE
ncbi:MAG: tyrosine-protein phosphatase [Rhodospirillaceae bacterium]